MFISVSCVRTYSVVSNGLTVYDGTFRVLGVEAGTVEVVASISGFPVY
ncbi:unnamed protein product [Staurois parvus]|uniref:Uncharacterized protein n=1 Tax=Staurois parvus TaxID=386267 RepID=A0ABN9DL01_9NEOB|nr:unnamed protein product [Staurois parvus]